MAFRNTPQAPRATQAQWGTRECALVLSHVGETARRKRTRECGFAHGCRHIADSDDIRAGTDEVSEVVGAATAAADDGDARRVFGKDYDRRRWRRGGNGSRAGLRTIRATEHCWCGEDSGNEREKLSTTKGRGHSVSLARMVLPRNTSAHQRL